jgi:hypothetical protein
MRGGGRGDTQKNTKKKGMKEVENEVNKSKDGKWKTKKEQRVKKMEVWGESKKEGSRS